MISAVKLLHLRPRGSLLPLVSTPWEIRDCAVSARAGAPGIRGRPVLRLLPRRHVPDHLDQPVHLVLGVVHLERSPDGAGDAEAVQEGVGAEGAVAHRDARLVQGLGDLVVRVPVHREGDERHRRVRAGAGAVEADAGDLGESLPRVLAELAHVLLHVLHAEPAQVAAGRRETHDTGHVLGPGLEEPRHLLELGAVQVHPRDHVAAGDVRVHLGEAARMHVEPAHARRPEHLVTREGHEVRPQPVAVDRHVGNALGHVDEDGGAVALGQSHDLLDRVARGEHVAHVHHAHQAVAPRLKLLLQVAQIQRAVVPHPDVAERDPVRDLELLPRDDVRMVLHLGEQDAAIVRQVPAGPAPGHGVDGRRGAGRDDQRPRVPRTNEARDHRPGLLVALGGQAGQVVGASIGGGIGLALEVPHGLQHRLRLLGRCAGIQERQARVVRQQREMVANVLQLRHRVSSSFKAGSMLRPRKAHLANPGEDFELTCASSKAKNLIFGLI